MKLSNWIDVPSVSQLVLSMLVWLVMNSAMNIHFLVQRDGSNSIYPAVIHSVRKIDFEKLTFENSENWHSLSTPHLRLIFLEIFREIDFFGKSTFSGNWLFREIYFFGTLTFLGTWLFRGIDFFGKLSFSGNWLKFGEMTSTQLNRLVLNPWIITLKGEYGCPYHDGRLSWYGELWCSYNEMFWSLNRLFHRPRKFSFSWRSKVYDSLSMTHSLWFTIYDS